MSGSVSPPRQRPTRRQLEVLRAYVATGSIAVAAHDLGITTTTARQHLSGLYRRTGYVNAVQAAYWLGVGDLRGAGRHPRWLAAGNASFMGSR